MGPLKNFLFLNYPVSRGAYTWTLDNEMVWRKTHHLGAKIMVGFSIFGIAISLIPQKDTTGLIVFLSLILIMVSIPIVYSYRLHKRLTDK
jgi:uncharacterized membrane protein